MSAPPGLVEDLQTRRESILDALLMATAGVDGQSETDRRQFVAGYLDLVTAAAGGNHEPRDNYLEVVIPGIKQGGMPLDVVIAGMVTTAMAISASVGPEFLSWHYDFARDYTTRLVREWQNA